MGRAVLMAATNALEQLDEWMQDHDASLKFTGGTGCCWSGELRVTLTDPPSEPARSITFYTTAKDGPYDAAAELLVELHRWLGEGGAPMPRPEWLN
jgi:hypothetical protein